jgi:quercetin 2,3-dioxygenase
VVFAVDEKKMSKYFVPAIRPLGFPWETSDPFLFCTYHKDLYPAGNEQMGPAAPLTERQIGQDFESKNVWRMYHGDVVPGFPQHPHRGFETVTLVRQGLVDHADSLGAAARYGHGDVQWLTAGRGILHAEMFPLLDGAEPNPLELFQIWLNLPRVSKMAEPHFSMFWRDQVPHRFVPDDAGRMTEITVVAGRLGEIEAPVPPPESWASRPESHVAIWTIRMEAGARWTLPDAPAGVHRTLFYYQGHCLRVGDVSVSPMHSIGLPPEWEAPLESVGGEAELLLLQGCPINEPVAARGPFVMNSAEEIVQAYNDYRRTGFGGWPWDSEGPVHAREGRFARYADGRLERGR